MWIQFELMRFFRQSVTNKNANIYGKRRFCSIGTKQLSSCHAPEHVNQPVAPASAPLAG